MKSRTDPHPNQDLFIRDLIDFTPRDERNLMERPFFSLSKRKRNKPIEYVSDEGDVWVKVRPHPEFGMATIWDADIMIWCISRVVHEKNQGRNLESPTLTTTPYELLKAIQRDTGGTDYRLLFDALNRLRNTSIETNLKSGNKKFAQFSWLAEFEGEGNIEKPEDMARVRSLSLTLPQWLYKAISVSNNVLQLDREYFQLTGGLERAIYRIARKHAGAQPGGWLCRFSVLHKKTGSDSSAKKFSEMMKKVIKDDKLPRYQMTLTKTVNGEPAVHFVDRDIADAARIDAEIARETENLERIAREDARAALIDSGADPRKVALRA